MKKNLEQIKMIDPPSGWRYGFPKEIPEVVTDVNAWLIENGYPKKFIDDLGEYFHYRIFYIHQTQVKEKKKGKSIIANSQTIVDPTTFDFDKWENKIVYPNGRDELVDPYGGHGVIESPKKEISNKEIIDGLIEQHSLKNQSRRYLPTLSELIDRLSIAQLKEVFIPEHKVEYAQEIKDILHDIDLFLADNKDKINAETIRAIVVLSQMNLHIWHNESNYRKGIKDGNNLELTHGLNGIRNTSKNKIQEIVGGRKDYKIDCLASEFKDWEISW
jgi:hypothetical protein